MEVNDEVMEDVVERVSAAARPALSNTMPSGELKRLPSLIFADPMSGHGQVLAKERSASTCAVATSKIGWSPRPMETKIAPSR